MSEEDERQKRNLGKLEIVIDRTEEMKALQEKNEELETTLKLIAEKEFTAQCRKFNLNPETSSPEDLKTAMNLEKRPPHGGDSQPYWQNELGGKKDEDIRAKTDLGSILVDSTEEGLKSSIEFLNYKKSHGNESEKQEARRLLSIAEKRIFSKNKEPLDIEFFGDIRSLTRHEIAIPPNATEEQIRKIEEYNSELRRKRSNWTKK